MADRREMPAPGGGQDQDKSSDVKEYIAEDAGRQSGKEPEVALGETNRFLDLLAPGGYFTFQTFDDSPSKRPELICIYQGTLDEHAKQLVTLNDNGAGIFVCINATDGKGRKAKNVTAVRGVFADFDDLKVDFPRLLAYLQKIGFVPTLVVETSPGKYHLYWLTKTPGELARDEFKPLQKTLARLLGSDSSVCDLPRVTRVPGFIHRKGEPFQTRIVQVGEYLTGEKIRETLHTHGQPDEPQQPVAASMMLEGVSDNPYIHRAYDRAISAVTAAPEGERNDTLNREAHGLFGLVKADLLDEQAIRQVLTRAAKGAGLSTGEVRSTLNSAWKAATPRGISSNSPLADFAEIGDGQAPRPLPDPLPSVPPFDAEKLLPAPMRDHVVDVAERLQAPIEYGAVAAMVAVAAVVGRKVRMRPKQHDDWTVTPNLWGVMIGGPSAMKSPVLREMVFPLNEIEAASRITHAELQAQYEREDELADMERQAAKKRAQKLVDAGKSDEARAVLDKVETPTAPPEHPARLTLNDATVEAAGKKLNENPNGLLLMRDELYGWLAKMQQEECASDRAFYLECYNGNGRYTYDRIGRGTVAIDHCTLSILGGIQPARLAGLVRGAIRGTDADGLLQRFQLAMHPDPAPSWQWVDRPPSHQAKEQYRAVFTRLHALPVPQEGSEPPHRHFSSEAQHAFIRWSEALHREARAEDLHPALAAHLMKMPKTVCSLALLFALVNGEQEAVSLDATRMALAWSDLLRHHSERLYSAATSQNVHGARLILSRREKLPSPFKAKQIQQRGWAGLDTTEAVGSALDLLEDHGYLAPIETRTGGRPRVDYHWHPSLVTYTEHTSEAPGDTPRNPPKRALRGLRGSSSSVFAESTLTSPPNEGAPEGSSQPDERPPESREPSSPRGEEPPDDDWLH